MPDLLKIALIILAIAIVLAIAGLPYSGTVALIALIVAVVWAVLALLNSA